MSVLGLIPARGGSKGIPRKNVLPIAGKPLIAWTIEAALASQSLDHVVVSTDDPEIADVARASGADVPFVRPAELARDDTPGIDPVLHALECMPDVTMVVLLQPTSPLRTPEDVEGAVTLAKRATARNVVSVTEARHSQWNFAVDDSNVLQVDAGLVAARRQDLPERYSLNGAIYVGAPSRLRRDCTFLTPGTLAYVMPAERSIDIDNPFDWRVAEMLLKDRQ